MCMIDFQILALSKHQSQYNNITDLAEGVMQFAADIAGQVNISGYAEGFFPVLEMS